MPFNAEDYVHRIGRTGRAGASGLAFTLVAREDMRNVGDIEKLIKKKIEIEPFELDEAPPRARSATANASGTATTSARRGSACADQRAGPAGRPLFDQPYVPSAPEVKLV